MLSSTLVLAPVALAVPSATGSEVLPQLSGQLYWYCDGLFTAFPECRRASERLIADVVSETPVSQYRDRKGGAAQGNALSALKILIRGVVMPFRASVIGRPVARRVFSTTGTVAAGDNCFRMAQAPATCGVAMDVPERLSNPPPGTEETMPWPGANRDRKAAEFENAEIASAFVVDPTLTAVEMQPGALMALVNPSFPDAITVAIRAERRLSIAAFIPAFARSQAAWLVNPPPPKLILTEAI